MIAKRKRRRREAGSEGSVKQTYGPVGMNKNRMRRHTGPDEVGSLTTKSISIKGTGCRSGGRVRKAVGTYLREICRLFWNQD